MSKSSALSLSTLLIFEIQLIDGALFFKAKILFAYEGAQIVPFYLQVVFAIKNKVA